MEPGQIEKHTIAQSILLHLLPGILVGTFYFLTLQPVAKMGYPSIFALYLSFAFVLVPFELGFLLYQGRKKTGRFTLQGIIGYRKPIPWWQYFVWVSIIFVAVGAIMTFFKPVDSFLHKNLFFWMPDLISGLEGNYSKSILVTTYSMSFTFNVFLAPIVEELYFRGYLLLRMKGRYAMFLHSFLFAVIHVFSPWMIISRTIGFFPIILGTTKKNIYVGMLVHCLANSMDLITAIVFITKMT